MIIRLHAIHLFPLLILGPCFTTKGMSNGVGGSDVGFQCQQETGNKNGQSKHCYALIRLQRYGLPMAAVVSMFEG